MKIKFVNKKPEDVKEYVRIIAKENNMTCVEMNLKTLKQVPGLCLINDTEHDYSQFITSFFIDSKYYFLLFGKKTVNDFKWMGYCNDELFEKFISFMHINSK